MNINLVIYFIPCLIVIYFYYMKFDYNYYNASSITHITALIMAFITIVFLLSKKCINTDYKSLFILGFVYSLFGFHIFHQFELNKWI